MILRSNEVDNRTVKFLTKGIWVAIVLFVLRYFICKFSTLYDFIGATGEVITVTLFIMGIYSCWLWKYNPLEKVPKLMGTYKGIIDYKFDGKEGQKETIVTIKQTLISIKIQIRTNEITSNTIVGNLVEERDEYVLYYTYITNPKSKYSKKNPIQYGTCRLSTENPKYLEGIYWTSRKTIGDIKLTRINQK